MATITPESTPIPTVPAPLGPEMVPPPPPEDEPEGLYEIIDGQVVEKTPLGAFGHELASLLSERMGPFAREHRLGRVVVELLFDLWPAIDRKRRPDVAFLAAGRWPLEHRAPRAPAWAVVPDLAIEIVSPTDRATAVLGEVEDYFAAGARRVWVVYPDQRKVYDYASPTTVRILALGDAFEGGDVLPGFRLALAEFFGNGPGAAEPATVSVP